MTPEERWNELRHRVKARREVSEHELSTSVETGQWADAVVWEEHVWVFEAVLEDMADLERKTEPNNGN